MKSNLQRLFYLFIFLISFSMMGQNEYWTKIGTQNITQNSIIQRVTKVKEPQMYRLDLDQFKKTIQRASSNRNIAGGGSNAFVFFPLPGGKLERFTITESPIMEPALAKKFPMIKTYKAIGFDDPTATMRFSVTQYGLHTMLLSGKRNAVFIDPYTKDAKTYIVYDKASLEQRTKNFECLLNPKTKSSSSLREEMQLLNDTGDQTLRTYRLALSCTAEYGNYFATDSATAVTDILAEMVIAINRVNEIFERDLAVRLMLVANNEELIYFGDIEEDPWDGEWNNTTQAVIDSTIGTANYDIGHNFNLSGGGNAGCIASVCVEGQKGSGYTGQPNPVGDPFFIDYVAHEMGHQFGAYHTMNYCKRSGNGTSEVEPGSGSSIMGYAGVCPPVNIQLLSGAHFNYVNIREISANIQPGGFSTCGTQTTLSNQPPVADAGADYIIPKYTAYVLRGTARDPDGTASLTYNWSQNDPEKALFSGPPDSTWVIGPLYRAIMPSASPDRYLPRLDAVLNGELTLKWEVTPAVARTMNFSFLVRDNGSGYPMGIGQTDADLMTVTTAENAGPFKVTSQNTAISWNLEETKTVTWDVAHTDIAPVSVANVNILLSTDGGLTFDTVLASNVPNDGSEKVMMPTTVPTTNQARIMVEAVDNLFYAVNTTEFIIDDAGFLMSFNNAEGSTCQPEDAIFNFTYNTFLGFSETTTFSAENIPTGVTVTFNPSTATADGTKVKMTVSNTAQLAVGAYTIKVVGTSVTELKMLDITLNIYSGEIVPAVLTTPTNAATAVSLSPMFTWEKDPNAASYEIEIAMDSTFSEIVETASVTRNAYTLTSSLNQLLTYYWRVRAINDCSAGDYSAVFSFTTNSCSLCKSWGGTTFDTSTTLVRLNTIDNVTQKTEAYSDFTALSTDVERETAYDLEVQVNTAGNYTTITKVWIDWNQNCSFNDPGEEYDMGTAENVSNGPPANSPLSIRVPSDAYLGSTTMRISTQYISAETSPLTPCKPGFDGEVEDYTLNVVETLSVAEASFSDFSVWPNPNNGRFSMQLRSSSNQDIHVSIYDIRGRRLYYKTFENTGHFNEQIQVENMQSGLYLLHVNDGQKRAVQKLVVR